MKEEAEEEEQIDEKKNLPEDDKKPLYIRKDEPVQEKKKMKGITSKWRDEAKEGEIKKW